MRVQSRSSMLSLGACALLGCGGHVLGGDDDVTDERGESESGDVDESDESGEPEPGCVHLEATVELPGMSVCAITPTGLVAFADDRTYEHVIARLDEALELEELARLVGVGCRAFVHDPSSGRMWLLDEIPDGPQVLHAFDEAGVLAWERPLDVEGATYFAESLLAHEGDLIVAGRHGSEGLVVQQLAPDGAAVWTKVGYQGVSPNPEAALAGIERGDHLVALDVGVALLGYNEWVDTRAITVLAVDDQSGEPLWATLAPSDAWDIALGSDGAARAFVSTLDEPADAAPGRTNVRALDSLGAALWDTTVDWPGLTQVSMLPVDTWGPSPLHIAWGPSDDETPTNELHVVRHAASGELECRARLPDSQSYYVAAWASAEARVLVGGSLGDAEGTSAAIMMLSVE